MDQLADTSERRPDFWRSSSSGSSGFLERLLTKRRKSSDTGVPFDVKGPLGMNMLFTPSEPLIDYVFVHGLGGGSTKTWCFAEDPSYFWPKAWLPMEPAFRHIRISSFGYNADWTDGKETTLNIHDLGRSLLESMRTSLFLGTSGTNPIVCVGHSMGGLVIKQAYVLARQDPTCASWIKRFQAMVFLATPHRGSDLSSLLNKMLRISAGHHPRAYISNLEQSNELLALLNDTFRHYISELTLFSFYETQPMNLGIRSAMIVQRESAVLGYPGERVAPLNSDHRGVCKFESPAENNYTIVRDAFQSINQSIIERISFQDAERSEKEIRRIDQYLGGPGKPEDDLKNLEEARIGGSCEWFAEKQAFQAWVDSETTMPPMLYWISAKPATGKSVLSGYVVNILNELNLDCSYYFFHHGDKDKSTASGLFRSIAFQMASVNADIRRRLISMVDTGIRFDKDDGKAVWRRVLLSAVFRAKWQQTQYWVIDALDECSDFDVLLSMLASIDPKYQIKLFITSRKTTELSARFADLQKLFGGGAAIFEEITFGDIKKDMALYLEGNREKLHVGDAQQRNEFLKRILDKSNGCFLWIRLVLEELAMVWSLQHVERVLEEVPQDMDRLYTRALHIMASKPDYARELARAILTWTVCAICPLTVPELRAALEIDVGDTIEELEAAIASLCAQLVYVDKADRVLIVHPTARTFLISKELDSEFAIDKRAGHLRLAQACLTCLCSDELKPLRGHRAKKAHTRQAPYSPFTAYACLAFAEHMRQTTAKDDSLACLLYEFLKTNVLAWIEYIAATKNLFVLTQTAHSLKHYLQRRIQYTAPLDHEIQFAESWVIDLQRLPTKFGDNLMMCPSSIYWLIPPFCPATSAIGSGFRSALKGIQVRGLTDTGWDDRLSCISKDDSQVVSIACSESIFAVGLQPGHIVLYHNTTCQEWKTFEHQSPLRHLRFDSTGSMLVSSGRRDIRVWEVESSSISWRFDVDHDILALTFLDNDQTLAMATRANMVRRWCLQTGLEAEESSWTYSVDFGDEGEFRRPPLTIAFSPDGTLVAIVYRGRPICLWDPEERSLYGMIGREKDPGALALGTNTSPASLVFNANEGLALLAAAYEDGDLCLFDYEELKLVKVLEANAQVVACSGDGLVLATGNSAGMVQLMEFETLQLLYRINANDYSIRCLAFSADNLRFLDARGTQCNVWEPAVLSGLNLKSDSSTDGAPLKPKVIGMSDSELEITTVTLEDSGDFFFLGKSDGTVCLYEAKDGTQVKILYRHTYQIPVTSTRWTSSCSIIVSADAASRFIACALRRDNATGWVVEERLMDLRIDLAILNVLISQKNDLLMVSTSQCDTVWDVRTKLERSREEYKSREPFDCLNNPWNNNQRILISATSAIIVDWESSDRKKTVLLQPTNHAQVSLDQVVNSVMSICNKSMIAVELTKPYGEHSTTQILIFRDNAFDTQTPTLVPLREFQSVGHEVLHLIGGFGSKLVFLSRHLWVCSVEIEKGTGRGDYTRHFPIPSDWRSQRQVLRTAVTNRGDILFTRTEEIAVIKHGLKFEDPAFLHAG